MLCFPVNVYLCICLCVCVLLNTPLSQLQLIVVVSRIGRVCERRWIRRDSCVTISLPCDHFSIQSSLVPLVSVLPVVLHNLMVFRYYHHTTETTGR